MTAKTRRIIKRGRNAMKYASVLRRRFEELTLERQLAELIYELRRKEFALIRVDADGGLTASEPLLHGFDFSVQVLDLGD